MDDIENYTSGNVPEQETQNTPIQDNQDILKNETIDTDSTVNNNTINNNNSYTAYQDFMYGYEPPAPDINYGIRKRKNTNGEKFIIFLFVAIILLAVGLSIYGITTDIYNSQKVIDDIKQQHHVVMYKQTKPKGANDLSNFVDENGKYTIEGVSAYVKDSIVEIYTYTDKTRKQMSGTGSGVVISKDGYIVTNAHVLNADGFHAIHTTDDKVYDARIIGRDSKTDIAVIKVDNANLV
ncbi:MAG: S1C family serine protease, partial [Ruminococcus sp.]|nr:S1C family serine protease [Ruminococcus sp.]